MKTNRHICILTVIAVIFLIGCGSKQSAVRYSDYKIEGLTFSVPSDWEMQKQGIYTNFLPTGAIFDLAYYDTHGLSVSDPDNQKALLEGAGLTVEKESEGTLKNGHPIYQFEGQYKYETLIRDASLTVFDYQDGVFAVFVVYLNNNDKEKYSDEYRKLIDSISFEDDAAEETEDAAQNTLSVRGLTITVPANFDVFKDGDDSDFLIASDVYSNTGRDIYVEYYEGGFILTDEKQNMDFDFPSDDMLSEEYLEIDGYAARRRKCILDYGSLYAETVIDTDDGCFQVTIQGYTEEELEEIEKIESTFSFNE